MKLEIIFLAIVAILAPTADSLYQSKPALRRRISPDNTNPTNIRSWDRHGPVRDHEGACDGCIATAAQEFGAFTSDGSEDVTTKASIFLRFDQGLSEVMYDLAVENAEGITAVRLHCGAAGTTGPVIANVIEIKEGLSAADANGDLASDSLTNDDLISPCPAGVKQNIASLKAAIDHGLVYLNVESITYPFGVVRGQIEVD